MLLYLLFALNAFFVIFLSAYVVKFELKRLRINNAMALAAKFKTNSSSEKIVGQAQKKLSTPKHFR
jgi:hypothetical protein